MTYILLVKKKCHKWLCTHKCFLKQLLAYQHYVFYVYNVFYQPKNLPVIVLKPHICKTNQEENGVGIEGWSEI